MSATAASATSGSLRSIENTRPARSRPIPNMISSAAMNTTAFCRRPSQRCPAPGIAQASRQTSTSVPSDVTRVGSTVVDFVVIVTENDTADC